MLEPGIAQAGILPYSNRDSCEWASGRVSNEQDLTKAEAIMNAAETDLAAYVESKQRDAARLAFLIRKVDEATAEYQKIRTSQQ